MNILFKTIIPILVPVLAFASSKAVEHKYNCISKTSSADLVRLVINPNGDDSLVMIDGEYADLDTSYSPQLSSKMRFNYRNNHNEGSNHIVIHTDLTVGAKHGFMALQWRGDAFSQTFFDCVHE